MNKKGVEMTLNTIIIAIICLIVLFVILAIFTNVMGDSVDKMTTLSTCAGRGGSGCVKDRGDCEDNEMAIPRLGGCGSEDDEGKPYCCVPK